MDRERHGGCETIMADQIAARSIRASLAQTCLARIVQHRQGTGPDLCARYRIGISFNLKPCLCETNEYPDGVF